MATVINSSKERSLSLRDVATAKRQVERERKHARYVITIDKEGRPTAFKENQHPQINVLAVVGPAFVGDTFLEETILLEIGFGHTYPYRRTGGLRNGSRPICVGVRSRFASITMAQLKNAFPEIRRVLVENMRTVTDQWNWTIREMPYRTLGNYDYMTGTAKGMKRIKGVRYSVSFDDTAMLASVLRSELLYRQVPLLSDLKEAARKIRKIISNYNIQRPSKKELGYLYSLPRIITLTDFLEGRNFQRHHYHILFEKTRSSTGISMFKAIVKDMYFGSEEIADWGELMMDETAPVFDGIYTWCVPSEWSEKKRWSELHQKKVQAKHEPTHLSFELCEEPVPF